MKRYYFNGAKAKKHFYQIEFELNLKTPIIAFGKLLELFGFSIVIGDQYILKFIYETPGRGV